MKNITERIKVSCDFDGGLHFPKICVACGEPTDNQKYQFVGNNRLWSKKILINFPVCGKCFEANQNYVNIRPIVIIGGITFLFSIFTIFFNQTNIPQPFFVLGGLIWLIIVFSYMYWTLKQAQVKNTNEIIFRRSQLIEAIKLEEIIDPKSNLKGKVSFSFSNNEFARSFSNINKGKYK